MRRELYPDDWPDIAKRVKDKADWRCSECGARHRRGYILTVHHIDGDPGNNSPENLVALCQRCHLPLHAPHRTAAAALETP